ncbi:MAG: inositol monophosphatase family protein [Desulfosudaceae bacterium]
MTIDIAYAEQVGTGAAYRSAAVLKTYFGTSTLSIRKKGDKDLVTEADTASEAAIIDAIQERFPDHDILAEESGRRQDRSRFCWIIDPLDGTTNFSHGIDIFAVSIALAEDDRVIVGIVLNPVTGELFTATRGGGARQNGRPITVSATRRLDEALLVTGFPYNFAEIRQAVVKRFFNCLEAAQGVRRLGSAALDLCYVACGRFEGFWEQNLQPWDTAAGMLIATEAGATVTDFAGHAFTPEKKELLATNGILHQEMLDLLVISER